MDRYLVKMRNLNAGLRNRRVAIQVQGHRSTGDDIGNSVWLHFQIGILSGGFHTDITSAKELYNRLGDAIKVAEG